MENEKEEFVSNSKVAGLGVLAGLVGQYVIQLLLVFIFSFFIGLFVSSSFPELTGQEYTDKYREVVSTFSYDNLISILTYIIIIVLYIVIVGRKKIGIIMRNIFKGKSLKYGVLTLVFVLGTTIAYNIVIAIIFNQGGGNANQEGVIELVKANYLLSFLSIVVLAPIIEEFVFRYFLFGGIRKRSRFLAYAVTGFVFMLMHSISSFISYGFSKELLLELLYLPPYLTSGLALCYCYEKSKLLGSSILAHFLNNLLSFLSIIGL